MNFAWPPLSRFSFHPRVLVLLVLLILLFPPWVLSAWAGEVPQASPASVGSGPAESSADEAALPPDMKKVLRRGQLVVATASFNIPPFVVQDAQGQVSGMDIDLARGIARSLGVEAVFVTASTFNGVIDLVATGQADIGVSKLSTTLSRAKRVRFSQPYLVLRHAMLLNNVALSRAEGDTRSIVKRFDRKIGVIRESAYAEFARLQFPKAEIVEFDRWDPDVLAAVRDGQVFGVLRDEFEVMKVMRSHPQSSLLLKPVVLTDMVSNVAVAVGWQEQQLLSWIDLYLSMNPRSKLTVTKLLETVPLATGEAKSGVSGTR
ncbi:MAG: ABC transporter substrate-binding protein [Alphaproteobacteria bacterium]